MKQNKSNYIIRRDKCPIFLVMCVVFLVMCALNFLTPLNLDDYTYLYSFKTGERITNVIQIIEGIPNHYNLYNGRTFAHILAPFFLMLPEIIFDICNSFIFLVLGYFIYRIVIRSGGI